MRGVSEEDTQGGARSEFVGSGGGEVGVAAAPKDTEVLIRAQRPVKHRVTGGETECLGRKNIEEVWRWRGPQPNKLVGY
jgi:hypothetical protein